MSRSLKKAPYVEEKLYTRICAMNEKNEKIVFDVAYQPQVRTNTDTRRLMLDVIIALCPAAIWAVVQFGVSALVVMVSSVASAVFFEWGYRKLMKKSATIDDLSKYLSSFLNSKSLKSLISFCL